MGSGATDLLPQDSSPVSGAMCANCGAPGGEEEWCLQCGYYERYGTCIAIDRSFESQAVGGADPTPAEPLSVRSIPGWAWRMAGVFLGLFVASLAARLLLGNNKDLKDIHGVVCVTQLLVGAGMFLTIHLSLFFQKTMRDSGTVLMDVVNPLNVWLPVVRELPQTERLVQIGSAGGWNVVFGLLVTGGFPSHWIDFGEVPDEKPRPVITIPASVGMGGGGGGPMIAVASGGGGGGGGSPDNLADAVSQLTEQGLADIGELDPSQYFEEDLEEKLLFCECVVVGYTTNESLLNGDPRRLTSVIVATRAQGQLRVVGLVKKGLEPERIGALLPKLDAIRRERPFVPCPGKAEWVEPYFVCRVGYKTWDDRAGLVEPKWDRMLRDLREPASAPAVDEQSKTGA